MQVEVERYYLSVLRRASGNARVASANRIAASILGEHRKSSFRRWEGSGGAARGVMLGRALRLTWIEGHDVVWCAVPGAN